MRTKESMVSRICSNAYDMYPQKHEPSKYASSPFPMYSYERAATIFWHGFIEELVNNDLSEDDINDLLRSKSIRYMFDEHEDELEAVAKIMANRFIVKKDEK